MAISSRHCEGVSPWQSSFVPCLITKVDPHVVSLLGMTLVYPVIARALARGNLKSSLRGLAQAVAIFHCPLHHHKGRSPRRFTPRDDGEYVPSAAILVRRHQVAPYGIQHPYQFFLAPPRPTLNLLFACYRRHHRWMLLDIHHYMQIVASCELRAYAVAMF